jgi:hypothetical protein
MWRQGHWSQARGSVQTMMCENLLSNSIPDGATCYFCLDDGPDDAGQPLVRDCSCRGDSAGFAHLPCIIQYAKEKSKQANEMSPVALTAFAVPWKTCPNCKQPYKNKLSLNLTSAFILYAEEAFGGSGNNAAVPHREAAFGDAAFDFDTMKVMTALKSKILSLTQFLTDNMMNSCNEHPHEILEELERHSKTLLTKVSQMKKDMKMDRWVHMPKTSLEYLFYLMLTGLFEAQGHYTLGFKMLHFDESTEDKNTALKHLVKARTLYNLLGMNDDAKSVDVQIDILKGKHIVDPITGETSETLLLAAKDNYENSIKLVNPNSIYATTMESSIQRGLNYALMLRNSKRVIEAERLLNKLAADSRRIHGPEHNCTRQVNERLLHSQLRAVYILPDCNEEQVFQALRYEDEGEICVVKGPLSSPRKEEDEGIFHVESNLISPHSGTPVICHGLVSASHLNGQLGDVRGGRYNNDGMLRLEVHFEKSSLKSALVKPENVRVAFELPSI